MTRSFILIALLLIALTACDDLPERAAVAAARDLRQYTHHSAKANTCDYAHAHRHRRRNSARDCHSGAHLYSDEHRAFDRRQPYPYADSDARR